jgi:hypothetical protein
MSSAAGWLNFLPQSCVSDGGMADTSPYSLASSSILPQTNPSLPTSPVCTHLPSKIYTLQVCLFLPAPVETYHQLTVILLLCSMLLDPQHKVKQHFALWILG